MGTIIILSFDAKAITHQKEEITQPPNPFPPAPLPKKWLVLYYKLCSLRPGPCCLVTVKVQRKGPGTLWRSVLAN